MSRATLTRVFRVDGASAVASSAHASSIEKPALVATATTGTAAAAPCRKIRRLYLLRRSTSLMSFLHCIVIVDFRARWLFVEKPSRSIFLFEHDLFGKPVPTFPDHALAEAATLLDHLDLVAVGVGDKEKPRQRRAVMFEIAQRPRRQFL